MGSRGRGGGRLCQWGTAHRWQARVGQPRRHWRRLRAGPWLSHQPHVAPLRHSNLCCCWIRCRRVGNPPSRTKIPTGALRDLGDRKEWDPKERDREGRGMGEWDWSGSDPRMQDRWIPWQSRHQPRRCRQVRRSMDPRRREVRIPNRWIPAERIPAGRIPAGWILVRWRRHHSNSHHRIHYRRSSRRRCLPQLRHPPRRHPPRRHRPRCLVSTAAWVRWSSTAVKCSACGRSYRRPPASSCQKPPHRCQRPSVPLQREQEERWRRVGSARHTAGLGTAALLLRG